jgi:hypothetical protein
MRRYVGRVGRLRLVAVVRLRGGPGGTGTGGAGREDRAAGWIACERFDHGRQMDE